MRQQQSPSASSATPLLEVFRSIPDLRNRSGLRHPLPAILTLAVCAMLCGARSLYAIAQWGRDHGSDMAATLGFTRGRTPAVSTLHEVFSRLDRDAFEHALSNWFCEQGLRTGEGLSIDGKTLRGIHGEELPGVHLVAAFAHQRGVVVGQEPSPGKGQELAAALALLERLPIQGRVVTGDALFANRTFCETVAAKKGLTSSS
jgi:hypothetical protein